MTDQWEQQQFKQAAHHLSSIIELARREPREGVAPMDGQAENALLSIVTHAARLGYFAHQKHTIRDVSGEDVQMIRNALTTSLNDLRRRYHEGNILRRWRDGDHNDVEPEEPPEAPAFPKKVEMQPPTNMDDLKAMLNAHADFCDSMAVLIRTR